MERVFVGRMHLHGQIGLRIDELDHDGQLRFAMRCGERMGAQPLGVTGKNLAQRLAACMGFPVRMGAAFPCLRKRDEVDPFPKIIIQPRSAPEIVLGGRLQKKRQSHSSYFFLSAGSISSPS